MPKIHSPRPTGRYFVYLIQLSQPLGRDKHQARFYLGIAKDWKYRYIQHLLGHGSKMLAYAKSQGIRFLVVAVWKLIDFHSARLFEKWAETSNKKHSRLLGMRNEVIASKIQRKYPGAEFGFA
jgi:predicted GIY-YIG superfamily endonuclease